jgi:methionyl aminopeptidase
MKRNKKKLAAARRESVSRVTTPEQSAGMRAAGRFAAELLDRVAELVRPGVTTLEIDQLVDRLTRERGARSAPLGYTGHGAPPFSGHCCTSVNDVVCHGIPAANHVLGDGDIINVDVTPVLDGWHGDSSRTFLVGDPSPKARRLVADTWRALWLGIRAVKPGARIGDIGHAIQGFAEAQGYAVVREFTGHGVGRTFHTAPAVLHYGKPGSGDLITPGMTFTVEPMINLGHWKTETLDDGWTAVTVDGSLSAQFEHTLLVTDDGVEVLTLGAGEEPPL